MGNIVLIGFTSCGKSVVGRALGEQLGREFIDLDDRIVEEGEKQFGSRSSCREIYQQRGEQTFRDLEAAALTGLDTIKDAIVATGGGTPLRSENQQILTNIGIVIYLQSSVASLMERIQNKGMPAYLRDDPSLENLQRAVAERDFIYRQIADVVIDRSEHNVEQTIDQILASVEGG